jgi:hypothetical protein
MSRKPKQVKHQPPAASLSRLGGWQWIALIAALVSLGGVLLWLVSSSRTDNFTPEITGAPSVEVAQERVDYGDVRVNTPVETAFRVRNVGDETLVILGEPQVELVEGC